MTKLLVVALQYHQLVRRGFQRAPRGNQFIVEQTHLLPRLSQQRFQLLVVVIESLSPTLIFLVLLRQRLQLLLLHRVGLFLGFEDKPATASQQRQHT